MAKTTSNRGNKSGASHFASIPAVTLPRSTFNRSHGHKTTFDSGLLIPILVDEVLPGDTMKLSASTFARMATPLKPVMDNLYLDTFFFAVPIRIIWDNFKKFMGEQDNPGDSTDFMVPISSQSFTGYFQNSLQDYMGIRPGIVDLEHNNLPMRAYNLIWNEWFRDENLQDSLVVDKDDGPDNYISYELQRRGKRHDYFTASLPFAQKGPAVELSFGGFAPVNPTGDQIPSWESISDPAAGATLRNTPGFTMTISGPGDMGELQWQDPKLQADLSAATGNTINQIREAFQIQKLLERDARGGTRYTELVRAHFGVSSPDSRLQRPEYLGGGSSHINVHPVAQTVQQTGQFLGDLGAFVTGGDQGHGFVKSFTEHCYIIGLAMIRADLTYQQGLNRLWNRRSRFDFYWPTFAHLGEQEVLNKEIFADASVNDDLAFGFQERYAEYRYAPSRISGTFRSDHSLSLDVWHLAIDFGSLPALNASFIEENPPVQRVIAVPGEQEFLFDVWFDIKHVRPMPVYSVPGLVDHF